MPLKIVKLCSQTFISFCVVKSSFISQAECFKELVRTLKKIFHLGTYIF